MNQDWKTPPSLSMAIAATPHRASNQHRHVVLAVGMYISFARPELFNYSLLSLLVGFALSQIGIYFGNRWGKRPRPDEHLNQALKGLDGRYTMYHYKTPASHLLVGPSGIWVISPRSTRGMIYYNESRRRYVQKGGNLYLKIFAQESLGRPDMEISGEIEGINRFLKQRLPEKVLPEIQAALVFTNEATQVEADNAPIPTMHIKKLKEFLRKTAKGETLSQLWLNDINAALGE
jgi:hypothetical protein